MINFSAFWITKQAETKKSNDSNNFQPNNNNITNSTNKIKKSNSKTEKVEKRNLKITPEEATHLKNDI